jgi:redox-sensitive bicupin YhaK (pirin superfamily)
MTDDPFRTVKTVIDAERALEGGGFPVRRPFPTRALAQVDPFLLLDEMGPVEWGPEQAIGAPDHPHRGFETVTYMIHGKMQHKDSAGNQGVIGPGDVQWMTAGSGVVHSEMPEEEFHRTGGLSHGFQIWVNLPARDKMIPPRYQEVPRDRIPVAETSDGLARVRVIAGEALGTSAVIETRTPIRYLHWTLQPGAAVVQGVPHDHDGLAYVFGGEAHVGEGNRPVRDGQVAILGEGGALPLSVPSVATGPAEILILTGVPLREPIARYGPFVMNTRQEIEQAIEDYQRGRLGAITV